MPSSPALTVSLSDATAAAMWRKQSAATNPQELNRYAYVNNNPVRYTDPTGHDNSGPEKLEGGSAGGGGGGNGDGGTGGTPGSSGLPAGQPASPPLRAGALPSSTVRSGPGNTVIRTIDPKQVRFSQDSASYRFKDGRTIDDLAEGRQKGTTRVEDVPAIRLVQKDSQLYTLDNRRLAAFQQAGVEVPYRMATPQEIAKDAFKFTTTNEGTAIRIRGGSR